MEDDLDNRILWVGPGMGNIMHLGPWPKAFYHLKNGKDPLVMSHLKLIDLVDRPKLFYGDEFAAEQDILQEAERGDFFDEQEGWDIIILDFIEAWQLGRTYWPTLAETPYDMILREWELKLKQLQPYQVWVRHDNMEHSTIIPALAPEYKLVVNIQNNIVRTWDGGYGSEADVALRGASFWNKEAAGAFTGLGQDLHVWQLK